MPKPAVSLCQPTDERVPSCPPTYSPFVYHPSHRSQGVINSPNAPSGSKYGISHLPVDQSTGLMAYHSPPNERAPGHGQDDHDHLHQNSLPAFPSSGHDCHGANPGKSISSDTFFASHRAHRSFRGVVEKFHQKSANTLMEHQLDPSHWSRWPSRHGSDSVTDHTTFTQDSAMEEQPSASSSQALELNPQKNMSPMCNSRPSRSLVHRLVNSYPDDDKHFPQLSSAKSQPFLGDCFPPPRRHPFPRSISHSTSTSFDSSLESNNTSQVLRSNDHVEESLACAELLPSTAGASVHTRSKDGLPSNSHHLLNSPELAAVQIATRLDTNVDHQSQGANVSPFAQSPRTARTFLASRRTNSTPKKSKALHSHHPDNSLINFQVDPPSDDAASILLALSRSEPPPKHGMALRRGRGGAARPDAQSSNSLVERSSLPSTPSGRRYRTRSQIHEEFVSSDPLNVFVMPSGESSPQLDVEGIDFSKNRKSRADIQHVNNLGHGLPPIAGRNGGVISVSDSNNASTCTSRSVTGDSLAHTPAHEPFSLYNLICKAKISMQGRSHPRVSDSSQALSTATIGTNASNPPIAMALTDDDARSSFSISTQATSLIFPSGYPTRRSFPPEVPLDPNFPRLYRAFFVPSAFGEPEPIKFLAENHGIPVLKEPSGSVYNSPAHGYLDLYTPRYVKGVGSEKVGLCCICAEPKDRGGEELELWLKMKVSSYSYHLSFFHGINNADGLPFSPPVEIRHIKRGHAAANEKTELKEGRCHQCNKWIPMEGVKMQEVKVPELFWWKHAKSCHQSRIPGECHVHILDEVYDLVARQQQNKTNHSVAGGPPPSSCSTPYHRQSINHDSPLSQLSYSGGYNAASPAPTCATSVSQPGSNRIHPSVAAQRASAGRIYKRKASNSSLNARKERVDPPSSSQYPNCSPFSMGITSSSSLPMNIIHHQQPQSPTPQQTSGPTAPPRKTRRSNAWNMIE